MLVCVGLIGSVVCVMLLTSFSSASEGPIGATLDRLATVLGSFEHAVRERVAGGGRRAQLSWFEPYRQDAQRLRKPDDLLLGAYDSGLPATLNGVVNLEQSLGVTLPLVQIYAAWGDKPDQRFPLQLLTSIWNMGSVTVVTWEPWLNDFENARHQNLPLPEARDRHGLASVARGDYDFYVDAWAAEAARFRRPFFLRFAHEMNDPYRYPWGPQNNTKEEFIAAWQHVRDRFHRAGADNAIWVWSPHIAYRYWETYYPPDGSVDWVATGSLNFGSVAHWSQWWTFRELFGLKYDQLAAFRRPIMIAEFGTLAVGGDRTAWYRDALVPLPTQHPDVRALLFFNARNDQTVTYQKLDWAVDGDPALAVAVRDALGAWPHPAKR